MAEIVLKPGSPSGSYFNNGSPLYGSPDGIYGEGIAWQVVNSASIAGSSIGVYLAAGGSLTQTNSGYIFGTSVGVEISNGVGTVSNAGTIASGAGATGGYSHNYGGISGGTGGSAIVLSQGGSIGNTGMIVGGAGGQAGSSHYSYGGTGGTGGAGIALSQGGSISNGVIGTIEGGQGGAGGNALFNYGGAGGSGGAGIVLSQGGSIGNGGTIAGGRGGTGGNSTYTRGSVGGTGGAGIVLSQSGSIGNTGTISGGQGGVGGNALFNYGGAGGAGGVGIVLSQGGSIDNTGTIAGGQGGAGGYGYAHRYGGAGGAEGIAIVIAGGGNVSNHAGGLIEGYQGIAITGAGTVSNAGTIVGTGNGPDRSLYGNLYGGGFGVYINGSAGVVSNSGMIEATGFFGDGVFVAGGAGTVTNSGTIAATGHYGIGIYLHAGGTVTNTAGLIEGYSGVRAVAQAATVFNSATISGVGPNGGLGVELFAGGDVTNNAGALITGDNGAGVFIGGGAGTLTNYGTIEGAGGIAVQFGGSDDVLVVEAGSKLVGSAAGGGGTLDLAGGAGPGTLSGLGSEYTGFAQLAVLAGAAWTLTGSNAAPLLTDDGTLSNTGTLTAPGITDAGSLVNSGSITANVTLTAGGYLDNAATGTITAGLGPNLIANGSFETPNVGTGWGLFGNGSVPGWTSNNNEIEIDYTPVVGGNAYAGNQSMELNGSTFDTVSQTVGGLTPGMSYTLSWAYGTRGGSGPERTDVSFGGKLVATDSVANPGSVVWTLNSVTVIATSSSETLSFAAINVGGSGGLGNEIDAVSLVAGGQTGVYGSGGPSTVTNAGTIAGEAGSGGLAGNAIVLAAGGTVTNGDVGDPAALITGAIGIDALGAAGVTVTNYGTIDGTGGTALQFAGSDDVLVAEAGSRLIGSAAGGGGTLELAGDAGAGTLTGSQYAGFARFAVLAGAAWTLTNSGDVGTISLGGASSLEFQGGTAIGQTLDYTGNTGLATLDAPSQFAATIADFRVGDTVDLADTAATSLSYSGTASGGTLTVLNGTATVATLAFSGPYSAGQFQLSSDGKGGSDIALAPPTVAAQGYAVNENTGLSETAAQGLLVGASPGTAVASLAANPAHGVVTLNPDGSFTYTPNANFYGSDSFTYTGSYLAGEGTSAAATVTIAVADTTIPMETVAGPYTGDENSLIALTGLSVSASPNSGDPLSTVISVAHGTVTAGGTTGATITLTGDAATIDSSLAGLTYTGALNYFGTDTLTMTTTDTVDSNQAAANAGIDINPQNVTVGNGNSTVTLGGGNDTVTLGTGSDTVTGGNGNDTIGVSGGAGNDSVTLGNGNDTVTLANGSNTVLLGNGNDTVMLGQGANTVTLGTGSDTVIVGNNSNTITAVGSATSTDAISAGNGNNTLNLGAGTYDITLGNGGNTIIMNGGTYDVTAGHGADLFEFETPQALLDMKFASNDELVFRNTGFDFGSLNGTGTTTPQQIGASSPLFSSHTDGTFASTTNRFAYDASTGKLYYDAHGSTPGSKSSLVADLSNKPHLTGANLFFTS